MGYVRRGNGRAFRQAVTAIVIMTEQTVSNLVKVIVKRRRLYHLYTGQGQDDKQS